MTDKNAGLKANADALKAALEKATTELASARAINAERTSKADADALAALLAGEAPQADASLRETGERIALLEKARAELEARWKAADLTYRRAHCTDIVKEAKALVDEYRQQRQLALAVIQAGVRQWVALTAESVPNLSGLLDVEGATPSNNSRCAHWDLFMEMRDRLQKAGFAVNFDFNVALEHPIPTETQRTLAANAIAQLFA